MAKATYRFLSNDRIEESEILKGHYERSADRIEANDGPVLVLHDTTEFTYRRKNEKAIGYTRKLPASDRIANGFGHDHKACGIFMHASLAISQDGLPLGLTSVKFWSRDAFKGTNKNKLKINPTRVPIEEKESIKWIENVNRTHQNSSADPSKLIHIGDRENDIYEFFTRCEELETYYLVRCCVNRLANETTLVEETACDPVKFRHCISFTDSEGVEVNATIGVKYNRLTLKPPIGKANDYPEMLVTFLTATETTEPKNRERISWTFITNLPIQSKKQALEAIGWYKQRWKIEVYFKVLKSGLKLKESRLRTSDRLIRLISICCILAWRIQWITMLNREDQKLSPALAFDETERKILALFCQAKNSPRALHDYIVVLASMGGYLARTGDPPPGNTVIWRGLSKLHDVRKGFEMAIVGN